MVIAQRSALSEGAPLDACMGADLVQAAPPPPPPPPSPPKVGGKHQATCSRTLSTAGVATFAFPFTSFGERVDVGMIVLELVPTVAADPVPVTVSVTGVVDATDVGATVEEKFSLASVGLWLEGTVDGEGEGSGVVGPGAVDVHAASSSSSPSTQSSSPSPGGT